MNPTEVICESAIRRMLPQSGLEPVGCGAPLWCKPADGHSVAGDHDSLAVLDRVEQAGEIPRRVGCRHRDHEYILSDPLRIYV